MLYNAKAGTLAASWLAVLLLWMGSGCALVKDLGWPGDATRPSPHNGQVKPCGDLCAIDPVFYGYHATCWSPWPEGWAGCPPPCNTTAEIYPEVIGDAVPGSPEAVRARSMLDEFEPPGLGSTDWDLAAPPDAVPTEEVGSAERLPGLLETTTPESDENERESSPFREEQPPTRVEETRVDEEGAGPAAPVALDENEPQEPDASAGRVERLLQSEPPDRCLTYRTAAGIDPHNPDESRGAKSSEAMPCAPLPEDLSTSVVAPVGWKLPVESDTAPAGKEEGRDETAASADEAAMPEEPASAPTAGTPSGVQAEAPASSAASWETDLPSSPGWASCSDENDLDVVGESPEGLSRSGESYFCPTDPVFFVCRLPAASVSHEELLGR